MMVKQGQKIGKLMKEREKESEKDRWIDRQTEKKKQRNMKRGREINEERKGAEGIERFIRGERKRKFSLCRDRHKETYIESVTLRDIQTEKGSQVQRQI